jgi:predicted amidohydrolase YtcJ
MRLFSVDLNYPGVNNIPDVKKKISEMVKTLKPGEWVRGLGWDEGKLEELRYIYASDLDPVSPDNPVWLRHTMGHYGTANSLALKLANITRDTPDPPGGTIDRYQDGTPTGVLKESAQSLVARLIPELSSDQVQEGIVKMIQELNKEGMTAVKDPVIDRERWKAYQNLNREDLFTVRIFGLWKAGDTLKEAQELIDRVVSFTKPYLTTGNDRLISGGIKIFLDGSGGARTAWLHKEWNKNYRDKDAGNYGYSVIDPEVFQKQVKMFHDAGLHISVHAIGDKAIDWTVDTFAQVLEENPIHGLRHGIIHCVIPTDHAIEVMAELQEIHDAGYPESQPSFMWWIGDTYAGNFGPERSLRLKPFKTFLEKDVKWGSGSDFPVTPFEARYGLWASVIRKTIRGIYGMTPFGLDEAVGIHNALRSYTIWNAHQMYLEDKIGSIEVGKYADIAIWNKDFYTVSTEEIKDIRCLMTMFEGKIVHYDQESGLEMSQTKDHP